jgi:hypothetical protein
MPRWQGGHIALLFDERRKHAAQGTEGSNAAARLACCCFARPLPYRIFPGEMPRYPHINPIAQAALSFTIMAGRARRDALKARQEELRDRLQTTQIEFVLTELNTSITFCDLALASKDPMKTRRNVQNARTGYETALRFSQKVQPYLESNNQYHEKTAHVRALLRRLGEQV